ncbi:N-formylglutamate deformylase [Cupriavidus pauculus]|uniref:N-formylglutamate deformylase n=1 Tax=Cupriavidus pauculus TaxID=82633 RepID=A0A2N5C6Z4_9BURK|nr:N-formylglutamate deformylase [Cupriavidus pauculus]PLP97995.1 N-formylglutamate deformylase [Cupriavidus pauculus]
MNPPVCKITQGKLPLVISIPHGGELLPDWLVPRLTPVACERPDTDWHLRRLYAFAAEQGASVVEANYSRYVIDVNRPGDGSSLYPGQTTTTLCPTETFRGEPLYLEGAGLSADEVEGRKRNFWQPYHAALAAEIARLRVEHANVLVWEAHSIAGVLPRLFEGKLPDLNIGTHSGASCVPAMREAVIAAAAASPFTSVADGRFQGGHITRHYGQPAQGVHTIQLEMVQAVYMDERAPFPYLPNAAARVQPVLRNMLDGALAAMAAL